MSRTFMMMCLAAAGMTGCTTQQREVYHQAPVVSDAEYYRDARAAFEQRLAWRRATPEEHLASR